MRDRNLSAIWVSIALLWVAVGLQFTQQVAQSAPDSPPVMAYSPETPVRVLDTRECDKYITTCAGIMQPQSTLVVQTGAPEGTVAVAANITITETAGPLYLTAWEGGSIPRPVASLMNASTTGVTVANFAMIPVRVDGTFTIYVYGSATHVVIDVMGVEAPIPQRTITLNMQIKTTGPTDLSSRSVSTWMACRDRGTGRVDYGLTDIYGGFSGEIREDLKLPGPGDTLSRTVTIELRGDLQTGCAMGFGPAGESNPTWWYPGIKTATKTINGTAAQDGVSAECLITDTDGNHTLRSGEGPEFLGAATDNGCTVVWTLGT